MTTYDDLGHPVALTEAPQKIISLVPSLTEAIAASAPGRLAGATAWCTHPADLAVPRFGGTKNPDVGGIVAAAPDLVVANEEENRRQDVERLRAAGVPVWVTDVRDVPSALTALGRLLDLLEATERGWYDAAWAAWSDRDRPADGADRPTDSVDAGSPRVRALIPIWRRPWMALGRGTYAGDVLARLGVDNVLATHAERYPRIDLDDVRRSTPYDVVVLPDEPYRFTADDGPEAFDVPAVLVDGRSLTWYGPAMVEAPRILGAALAAATARPAAG